LFVIFGQCYRWPEASATRISYLFDVSVSAGVQRDSVGRRCLLSLGNVIFGGRPVQRAFLISSTCRCQPASNVTVSAGVVCYLWAMLSLAGGQCQTRIFYLFDVSVPAGVQRDSVGRRCLLSLGNVIFGGRPVSNAHLLSLRRVGASRRPT